MTDTPNPPDPNEPRPDGLTSGDPLRDERDPTAAAAGDPLREKRDEAGGPHAAAAAGDPPRDEREPDAEPHAAGAGDPPREEPPPSFLPPRAWRDHLGDGPERPVYDGPDLAAASAADGPRRLTRSSNDRMLAGVSGGLGRYFNVDPLLFRIAFVVLTFAGGFGLLAYLMGAVAIPEEGEHRPQRWGLWRTLGAGLLAAAALAVVTPHWLWGPELPGLVACGVVLYLLLRVIRDEGGGSHLAHVAARIALGILLLALATAGFAGAAAGTALGGGILIAGTVIALGVALLGGAFRGGARWLIVPAFVLALPLGVVSAADLEVKGPWGDRTYRPLTAAELSDGYQMGFAHMQIDARKVDLPPGRTELALKLGAGELEVAVPDDVCVTYDVNVGAGDVTTLDGIDDGGVDLDVTGAASVPPGVRELHVTADVGLGAVSIGPDFVDRFGRGHRGIDDPFPNAGSLNTACKAAA
jgi:phage shock protein PspC (stress-responsive transcriptional regulator)